MSFHEVLFPLDIALKSAGGPERNTEIVTFGSGREQRNARWANSRRRYDAGYGVKTLPALQQVVAFLRNGADSFTAFAGAIGSISRQALPAAALSPLDQTIGTGDGTLTTFQLMKTYGGSFAPYARTIAKPIAGSVRVAVAGVEAVAGTAFTCDSTTGLVTFATGHVPASGAPVTAGFNFDVPVRFDTDYLEVDLSAFAAGAIPKIPLIEIRP